MMKMILAMVMALTGCVWADQKAGIDLDYSIKVTGRQLTQKEKDAIHNQKSKSDELTRIDLNHLTKAQYVEFAKALIELSKDQNELSKTTKTVLTGILGLEGKEVGLRMLDIDPIWNRSALFAIVAVSNKIKLDAEDMENWKKACIAVALKTEDKELRLLISVIYASVLSQNERLPQEKR